MKVDHTFDFRPVDFFAGAGTKTNDSVAGNVQVCKILVRDGKVPADAMTHDSTPPMHLAVWKGQLATAEWLLTVVDNLHYVNDYGCDTSHWVAMSGDIATAEVAP